jgi:AhpD family alkylhydroperoxidase
MILLNISMILSAIEGLLNGERVNGGEDSSMLDWNEYRQELSARIGEIGRTSPEIIRGYRALGAAGQSTKKLDDKIRELIALAVAVTLRCDGCIATHTAAALKTGATEAEIVEALGVATSVSAGAALVYSARVLDAFHAEAGATSAA